MVHKGRNIFRMFISKFKHKAGTDTGERSHKAAEPVRKTKPKAEDFSHRSLEFLQMIFPGLAEHAKEKHSDNSKRESFNKNYS